MRWLPSIFRRPAPARKANGHPVAIPIPDGSEAWMWERPGPPKRNRKKHTAEEIAEDDLRHRREMRAKASLVEKFNRERALSINCKTFVWRSTGDSDVCEECARNNGKRFSYARPPKIGFPGEHECPIGWCRCIAIPTIPK